MQVFTETDSEAPTIPGFVCPHDKFCEWYSLPLFLAHLAAEEGLESSQLNPEDY